MSSNSNTNAFNKYTLLKIVTDCHVRGQHGFCQLLEDCPDVINLILHNSIPHICEFEGLKVAVCCLNFERHPDHRRPPNQSHGEFYPGPYPGPYQGPYQTSNPSQQFTNNYEAINNPHDFKPPFRTHPERPNYRPPLPYPFVENNEFQSTTSYPFQTISSTSPHIKELTSSYSVSSTLPTFPIKNNLDDEIPISVKKCLEYYPVPRFPSFVTGGEKSLPKQYPHMALIGFGNDETDKNWLCGGSLISKKFILTAAHCLFSSEFGYAKWVHLGDLDLSTDTDDALPQDFNITRRIPYPDFKPPQKYHDIALLELDKVVKLSSYVAPACLQTTKEITDTSMTATGWGKTGFAEDSSQFLMQVGLNEIGVGQCQNDYGVDKNYLANGIVDDMQICAGGSKGKDTCSGDSGGPLQIKNPSRSFIVQVHTVVGITSFGKACGLTHSAGVYTRVSNYVKWIESIVWENDQD